LAAPSASDVDPAVAPATRRDLLVDPAFRRWFASRSISTAGTAGSAVALPLLAYSGGSAQLTAAVVGAQALPYLLFGLFAGAAADRLRRKAMMVGADVVRALLLATVPVAATFGAPASWHVLLVAFAIGCGFCWFDAAAWGAVVQLVGKVRLTTANSLIWSTEIGLEIGAPAVAGLLAAATHPSVVLAVDALSYLASAALLLGIRAPMDAVADLGQRRRSVRGDIGVGLAYVWRQPVIRTLTLTGFGFNVACGGALGLLVVHADEVLRLRPTDTRIGLLYTAAAVGAFIASMALPVLGRRIGHGSVSMLGYAVSVAATVALAVNPALAGALALWALWEFGRIIANGNSIIVRQLLTPEALQGRVNTTGRMISWGGAPFGALLGGLVAELAGARAAYLVLALPVLVGLGWLLASPVRGLRIATS
jgi:MFS family permease